MVLEPVRLLKVVLLGDGNVGKTSLMRQFCEGRFEVSRIMTIGVDFQTQLVQLVDSKVKLSIWDIAGQERFAFMRDSFYRGSLAAALTYDVMLPETLMHLPRWQAEVQRIIPQMRFIVVGNKADLLPELRHPHGEYFARVIGAPFLLTSALTALNVPKLFQSLAELALGRRPDL
jgi:small GTP-binding protein